MEIKNKQNTRRLFTIACFKCGKDSKITVGFFRIREIKCPMCGSKEGILKQI